MHKDEDRQGATRVGAGRPNVERQAVLRDGDGPLRRRRASHVERWGDVLEASQPMEMSDWAYRFSTFPGPCSLRYSARTRARANATLTVVEVAVGSGCANRFCAYGGKPLTAYGADVAVRRVSRYDAGTGARVPDFTLRARTATVELVGATNVTIARGSLKAVSSKATSGCTLTFGAGDAATAVCPGATRDALISGEWQNFSVRVDTSGCPPGASGEAR